MIKEFIINLERKKDNWLDVSQHFPNAERFTAVDGNTISPEHILPYVADREWRDPYWNRRLTKGEIGCILSHIQLWKKCVELNEGILILEDDVVIHDVDYQAKLQKYADTYDLIYLGKKYIEGASLPINHELEYPGFCYWTCAYYINPFGAQTLLDYFEVNPLIPADEVLPIVIKQHRNLNHMTDKYIHGVAFTDDLISPKPGAFDNSETEVATNIWEDYNFHILTCGTDEEKVEPLMRSTNHSILNLGKGVEWQGGNMELGPGGGQKINLIKPQLEKYDDDDIVMFCDGYDVFINDEIPNILSRYFEFCKEVVFSAEPLCWPDESIAHEFPETGGYKYLNSGTFIGTVRELKRIFEPEIENYADDQLYVQKQYLTGKFNMMLDYESYIFFCLSGCEHAIRINDWGQVVNGDTNCTTCVVHGNGGGHTKEVYNLFLTKVKPEIYVPVYSDIEKLDTDIILIKNLLTEDFCNDLIDACNELNTWKPLPSDKFPAQEIRLKTLADDKFFRAFEKAYLDKIRVYAEKHWPVLLMYGIRDLFAMKYSLETQKNLPLHHDMSLVSGSMKLNDDFEGATLNFPRQNINNRDHKVGDMMLWPAQVTHPHECTDLIKGVKYSLTLWTSREQDDVY